MSEEKGISMATAKKESLPAHGQAAAIEIHGLVVKYGSKRAVNDLTLPAGRRYAG